MHAVLLQGRIFAGLLGMAQNKNIPAPHMVQNKTPWRNIVCVVCLNGLPVTIIYCVNGSQAVLSPVLLLGHVFSGFPRYFNIWCQNKKVPGHHMAQNKIPWHNIVSVVHINDLPITLVWIMPYRWYGIVSRRWVMINAKYLSSHSFLIWYNAKIYWCSHFKCHIYTYLLNIRTMLEGWERFWWAGDLGW